MSEEENLHQPPNDDSSSTGENKTVADPSTINDQPSTIMEVHKHPHHVTHKKKWGEYLLEFLMLFLAVFLGFVAENFRESSAERHREKEYMVSMLVDLRNDTLAINRSIIKSKLLVAGFDSTLHFLTGDLHNRDTAEMALVYFFKYCIYSSIAKITDGTITQLKNNGGLRLVRDKNVIDKINLYYLGTGVSAVQESSMLEYLNIIDQQAGEVFNYISNKDFINSANLDERALYETPLIEMTRWLQKKGPIMLTNDLKVLSPFMNNMSYHMGLMQTYVLQSKNKKETAIELMQAIKKSYHIENE